MAIAEVELSADCAASLRLDQLETAGAKLLDLEIQRVEGGLSEFRFPFERSRLGFERIRLSSKLVEATSIGVRIGDKEFGGERGGAPICVVRGSELNDAIERRADRFNAGVYDRLDACRREHRSQRHPAKGDDERDPDTDFEEARAAAAKGFVPEVWASALSATCGKLRSKTSSHRPRAHRTRLFLRSIEIGFDRRSDISLCGTDGV